MKVRYGDIYDTLQKNITKCFIEVTFTYIKALWIVPTAAVNYYNHLLVYNHLLHQD